MVEREIIRGCLTGDRSAQRALYDRTINRIYRLLSRMTNNDDDALDLAQEVYLRAFERIHEFRGNSAIETWLYRIAVNEALQFLRRARTERTHLRIRAENRPADRSNDDSAAARLDMTDALAAVGPDDRLILLLRYDQGLDYRQIAHALDCAEGTVASRLNRARERVRNMLAEGYGAGEEVTARAHPMGGRCAAAVLSGPPWMVDRTAIDTGLRGD